MTQVLIDHLQFLYGDAVAATGYPRLEQLIASQRQRLGAAPTKLTTYFDERDSVLITYGDMVQEAGDPPLYTLANFLEQTVKGAINNVGPVDATVTFIPGPALKNAVYEAIDAGVKFIVSPVERIPVHDVIAMVNYALKNNARLLGPGSLGVISPGKAAMGWLGGSADWAQKLFEPGPIGVISRSGGQSGTVPWALKVAGLGISTALHIGTEPVLGLSMAEVLAVLSGSSRATHRPRLLASKVYLPARWQDAGGR